jgi:putative sterol carrier protein
MSQVSFRDLIERMVSTFDPEAAGNLVATIQLHATGKEPGNYYLHIEDGKCTFHEGVADSPTATIHTPSEVWVAIISGEMNAALAYLQGKFRVEGDKGLLLKMQEMFKRR